LSITRFDQQASAWDTPYRIERARAISAEIMRQVPFSPQDRVLEFGCGTGLITFNLIDAVASVAMVDTSTGMLAVVKEKIAKFGVQTPVTLTSDLFSADLPEATFDCIYTSMVLHHIQDFRDIARRFSKLLKENGVLCIVDLMPDDGSFHLAEPGFDGHNGFDPLALSAELEQAGFVHQTSRVFYANTREFENRSIPYSLFILVMRNQPCVPPRSE